MFEIACFKEFSKHFCIDTKLEVPKGEFCALFGASGSGKTSLLRIIAGLEKAHGYMKNDEKIFFNEKIFLSPQERNIGFLFQDYALFANLDVRKNLLFAKNEPDFADFLLNLCDLYKYKNCAISMLSGGQKQRVALARALMRRPEILLLDEPFSALDSDIKARLQDYLLKIHSTFKNTIILVSHDLSDIYKLSKRTFIMENGKITKSGKNAQIFSSNDNIKARILEFQDDFVIIQIANEIKKMKKSALKNEFSLNDEIFISLNDFSITKA